MDNLNSKLKTIKAIGIRRIIRLFRAYRLSWQDTISGYYTTRIMQTLFNVGFFDELQTAHTIQVDSFAQRKGLDEAILQSCCDSIYALGILDKNEAGYTLASKGRSLVEVGRGWFDLVYGYESVFHNLEAMLHQEKTYGQDLYRRPDFVARGSGEIEQWVYFPIVIEQLNQMGCQQVLDLGCGDGTFLRNLCKTSQIQGYGVDVAPEAIATGNEELAKAELEDRIELFVLDINKIDVAPAELKDIDAATVFFVLHELLHIGRETVIQFLRSYRTIFPQKPLIVLEVGRVSPDELRSRPGMMVQYTLFHDLTHQKLVSRDEWRELFSAAGFENIQERYLAFAKTSIFTLS